MEAFCYSAGFEPCEHYPTIRTDIGWGCMHRVTQMLLYRVVSKVFNSADKFTTLGQLFRDTIDAPFGIQSLLQCSHSWGVSGSSQWSPGMACDAVKTILAREYALVNMTVKVYQSGSVTKNEVIYAPLPLLVLCPLRLGDKNIESNNEASVCTYMNITSSVGAAGGRKNSGYYFFDFQRNGMHYLDPHVIGNNVRMENSMKFSKLDPCIALAFCITNEEERHEFIETVNLQEFLYPNTSILAWEEQRELSSIADEDWEVFT